MNDSRLTDNQIRDFIKEYLYKEKSYNNIIIYPANGKIVIEYTGDKKTTRNTTFVVARIEWNYPTLYKTFKLEFDNFIDHLTKNGVDITIDANKLVRAKKDSDRYIETKKNFIEFRSSLIKICYEFKMIDGINIIVNEMADKIKVSYKDKDYILEVPDHDEIMNKERHRGILQITYNYLKELVTIITEEK